MWVTNKFCQSRASEKLSSWELARRNGLSAAIYLPLSHSFELFYQWMMDWKLLHCPHPEMICHKIVEKLLPRPSSHWMDGALGISSISQMETLSPPFCVTTVRKIPFLLLQPLFSNHFVWQKDKKWQRGQKVALMIMERSFLAQSHVSYALRQPSLASLVTSFSWSGLSGNPKILCKASFSFNHIPD